jgi:hypothetical protein
MQIVVVVPQQPPSSIGGEVSWLDHYQPQSVGWNLLVPTLVVQLALLSAVDTADSESVGFVEVPDRTVVLDLPVLHHQSVSGPVAVNGQCASAAILAQVTTQPIEAGLPSPVLAQQFVAQVEYIRLVAGLALHGSQWCPKSTATTLSVLNDRVVPAKS